MRAATTRGVEGLRKNQSRSRFVRDEERPVHERKSAQSADDEACEDAPMVAAHGRDETKRSDDAKSDAKRYART